MRTAFGFQVDAWGALIMDKGSLAEETESLFKERIRERGIDGLEITKANVRIDPRDKEEREHLVLTQTLGRKGDLAKLMLRFARRGSNDLEIYWRLFEQNPSQEKRIVPMFFIGLALTFIGATTLTTSGLGCILAPFGFMMMGASILVWMSWAKNTSAPPELQFESRALAKTVDYVIMRVLAEKGCNAADLRIIEKAQIEGLGQLI